MCRAGGDGRSAVERPAKTSWLARVDRRSANATWSLKRHCLLTVHDDARGVHCDSHFSRSLRLSTAQTLNSLRRELEVKQEQQRTVNCIAHERQSTLEASDTTIRPFRTSTWYAAARFPRYTALTPQPTAADIRRKNANFAARAQAGKKTARPARSTQRRSVGTWVLLGMGFLLVGGSESRSPRGRCDPYRA